MVGETGFEPATPCTQNKCGCILPRLFLTSTFVSGWLFDTISCPNFDFINVE